MHLMFVCEKYLFLDAKCFPRVKLEDNCKILGRDTVSGQTNKHIFHQMGPIEFIILQKFCNARKKLFTNSSAFVARIFKWYDFLNMSLVL